MPEAQEAAPPQPNEGGNSGFTPPASQEELNRIIGDRLERERAKFGDYDDLKAKAAQFDEIEAANKTELERANEAKAAADERAAKAEAEALRLRIATKHGISDSDDIELFLTGQDEETLTKQAKRLSDRVDQQRRQGNHVPGEGTTTSEPAEDEMRAFTRNLFQSAEQ